MKKFTSVLMIASCLLFSVLILGCSSQPENGDQEQAKINAAAPPREVQQFSVEIAQMKFTPAVIMVHKGDMITFTNHDIVIHDVTEEGSRAWSSDSLHRNQSWVYTADKSVDYFCSIHPTMKGKIIVE